MAYLIKAGSLDNFSIRPAIEGLTSKKRDIFTKNSNIRSYAAPETLSKTGGLGLGSFTLYKNFDGLRNLFNPQNEIYFIAWTWDLSGNAPYVYPAKSIEPGSWFHRVKKNDSIQFIGEGLNLYPKQEIKGGVGVHIEVWESDNDIRNAGKIVEEITSTIQESDLKNVLTGLAATNPTTATIAVISKAVLALSGEIGKILKNNSDDFVNLFEGYYDVDSWTKGRETYKNPVNNPICEIILNRF